MIPQIKTEMMNFRKILVKRIAFARKTVWALAQTVFRAFTPCLGSFLLPKHGARTRLYFSSFYAVKTNMT